MGAVTEEQVKRYIESQDDELSDIQVWDEPKEQDGELQSDCSEGFEMTSVLPGVYARLNLPALAGKSLSLH